jgi:hypothetical protein
MSGFIRLRNPAAESTDVGMAGRTDDDSGSGEETSTSTESGEQEHEQEHEHQEDIDHGLQRFEVLSRETSRSRERHSDQFMRAKLEEQETLIARLEEDNLTLREKLYLAEQELKDLRKRATSGDEAENYLSDGEASCAAP